MLVKTAENYSMVDHSKHVCDVHVTAFFFICHCYYCCPFLPCDLL